MVGSDFQIIEMEEEEIREIVKKFTGKEKRGLLVLANPIRIYVPFSFFKDKDGNYLPDFCVLGHEIWHLPELGGSFHK